MRKNFVLIFTIIFALSIFAFGCQNTAKRPLEPNQPNNVRPNDNMGSPNTATSLSDNEARTMAKNLTRVAENVQGVKRASVVVSDGDRSNSNNNGNMGNAGNVGDTGNVGGIVPRINNNSNMGTNRNQGNGAGITGSTVPNTDNVGAPIAGLPNNTNRTGNSNLPGGTNNMNNFPNTGNVNQITVMVGIELDNNTRSMNNIEETVANKIKASDSRINQVFVTTDKGMMQRIDDVAQDVATKPFSTLTNDIDKLWRNLTAQGPAF